MLFRSVAVSTQNLELRVNLGKAAAAAGSATGAQTVLPGFDFTEVTGLDGGLQFFAVQSFTTTVLGLEAFGTTAGAGVQLLINTDGTTPTVTSDPNADADAAQFALSGDFLFRKTTLANGAVVTKISLTTMRASLGPITLTGNALILLTPAGLAAEIDVTVQGGAFTDGTNAYRLDSPTFQIGRASCRERV